MNSGARKNASSASRPLNRKRTSPIAAMIPSAQASTAAESPSTRLTLKKARTNSALAKKARYHFSVSVGRREIEVRARPERDRDHDRQRGQQQHVGQRHERLQQRGHLAVHVPCSCRPVRRVIASAMKESEVVAITSKVAIADALGH